MSGLKGQKTFVDKSKPKDMRTSNILAGKCECSSIFLPPLSKYFIFSLASSLLFLQLFLSSFTTYFLAANVWTCGGSPTSGPILCAVQPASGWIICTHLLCIGHSRWIKSTFFCLATRLRTYWHLLHANGVVRTSTSQPSFGECTMLCAPSQPHLP